MLKMSLRTRTYSTSLWKVLRGPLMESMIGWQDSAARTLAKFIDGLSKSDKNDFWLRQGELILERNHRCMNGWNPPTRTSESTLGYLVRLGWIDIKSTMFPRVCPPVPMEAASLTNLQAGFLDTLPNLLSRPSMARGAVFFLRGRGVTLDYSILRRGRYFSLTARMHSIYSIYCT